MGIWELWFFVKCVFEVVVYLGVVMLVIEQFVILSFVVEVGFIIIYLVGIYFCVCVIVELMGVLVWEIFGKCSGVGGDELENWCFMLIYFI